MDQASTHMAYQRLAEADDTPGDAAGIHDLAGQDEERHGQQRETVDTVVQAGEQGSEEAALVIHHQAEARAGEQCKHHRHTQRHQHQEQPEECRGHAISPAPRRPRRR